MSDPPPEHVEHRLREALAERAIDLRSMSRQLRLITGFALAQLLVMAALLIARVSPFALVNINPEVALPLPILVATVLFLATSWALILAGAVTARWPVTLLILALFAYEYVPFGAGIPALVVLALVACVVVALALVIATIASDRLEHLRLRRIADLTRSHGVLVFLPLTLIPYAVIAIWQAGEGHAGYVGGAIGGLVNDSLVVVIPALIIAGSDFAEWAQLSSETIVDGARRRLGPRVLALGGVIAFALPAALVIPGGGSYLFKEMPYAIGFAALVVVIGLALRNRPISRKVPYVAMAVAVAFWVIPLNVAQRVFAHHVEASSSEVKTYRHDEEPRYAFDYPASWKLNEGQPAESSATEDIPQASTTATGSSGQVDVEADGYAPWSEGYFRRYLIAGSYQVDGRSEQCDASRCAVQISEPESDHGWDHRTWSLAILGGTDSAIVGDFWQRDETTGFTYRILGVTTPESAQGDGAVFQAVRDSWTSSIIPPGLSAEDTSFSDDLYRTAYAAAILAVGVLGLIGLLGLIALGRRSGRGAEILALLALVGLFIVAFNGPPYIANYLNGVPSYEPALTYRALSLLVGAAALVAGLALLARPSERRSRLTGALVIAAAGVGLVWALNSLFGKALSVGEQLSWAQALIVLLALSWDVVMSGETITNRSGKWFPRESRVLLFLGYIGFVATSVLFYSSQFEAATGTQVESQFESEAWPQFGLTALGIPLIALAVVAAIAAAASNKPGDPAETGLPESG